MRCTFCEDTNYVAGYTDGETYAEGTVLDVRFDADENELDFMVRHDGRTVIDRSFPIDYCPMCGRRLR